MVWRTVFCFVLVSSVNVMLHKKVTVAEWFAYADRLRRVKVRTYAVSDMWVFLTVLIAGGTVCTIQRLQ